VKGVTSIVKMRGEGRKRIGEKASMNYMFKRKHKKVNLLQWNE